MVGALNELLKDDCFLRSMFTYQLQVGLVIKS